MTQIIAFREDGSQFTSTTADPNLTSKVEPGQAIETWQIGYVKGRLAVSRKTVGAVNEFLSNLPWGSEVNVTYRPRLRRNSFTEVLRLQFLSGGAQPVLLPIEGTQLEDHQIARELDVFWGEYVTVTYKPLNPRAAVPVGIVPDLEDRLREQRERQLQPGDLIIASC
jgi:hypothetical protein